MSRTPLIDLAFLAAAVVLMVGGAVVLVGDWVSAGIAIPAIAIGIALVVIGETDARRREHRTPHPQP
jgi:hypothetical protein